MTNPESTGYAGDLTPEQAWSKVTGADALLVDVRTPGEWQHIGVPRLDADHAEPDVLFTSWTFSDGSPNPQFLADIAPFADRELVLLCRSGRRSVDAAVALSAAGFTAYNVLNGFEAPGGWRDAGLPWRTGWSQSQNARIAGQDPRLDTTS